MIIKKKRQKKTQSTTYGLSNNMWKSLVTWHSVHLLPQIYRKIFHSKTKELLPHFTEYCLWGFFMVLLGKQSFSPLHWKALLMGLSGEILCTGGTEPLQGIAAFAFRRKGGKSKFWGSALTVLLVKRFCRSRVCSPCSCFGTEVVCLACLKAWQRNNHKIQRWHHWHSCAMLIPRSCICF